MAATVICLPVNPSRWATPTRWPTRFSDAVLDYCLGHDPRVAWRARHSSPPTWRYAWERSRPRAPLTREAVDKLVRDVIREIGYVAKSQADARKLDSRPTPARSIAASTPRARTSVRASTSARGRPGDDVRFRVH